MQIPLLAALVAIIIALGTYIISPSTFTDTLPGLFSSSATPTAQVETTPLEAAKDTPAPLPKDREVIGVSKGDRSIVAHYIGAGTDEVLFVGGIHGGYSPGTSLVAYEALEWLKTNSNIMPKNVRVTIIPTLNPDGLAKVVTKEGAFTAADISGDTVMRTAGRFNGNTVDLNRNFDCDWKANAEWQNKDVSGGTAAFSEPEAEALKKYVEAHNPKAVVVWYAAAGGVYASNCHDGVLAGTKSLLTTFAQASGYK